MLYFLFQILTNVQTKLTIVTIPLHVSISMVHLIVFAILVIWGMVQIVKVILHLRIQRAYSAMTVEKTRLSANLGRPIKF